MPPALGIQVGKPQGMQDNNLASERIKFGFEGRSPRAEVQEAGGGLLPQGLGARSPQRSCRTVRGRSPTSKRRQARFSRKSYCNPS